MNEKNNFTDGIVTYSYAQFFELIGYDDVAKELKETKRLNLEIPKKIVNIEGHDYYILKVKGLSIFLMHMMGAKKVGFSKNIFDKLKAGECSGFSFPEPLDDDKYLVMADGTLYIK